jgi:outer membrane receptor for ferric coprogen and ferric-rhodotorulic acid
MSGPFAGCRKKLKRAAMLGTAAMIGVPSVAFGAPAPAQTAEGTMAFNIPAGPVSQSLRAYAEATGLQLIYNANLDTAGTSRGVSGTMSKSDALFRLLEGTGLTFRFVNSTTATIEGAPATGERVLGAVRVEGEQHSPYFGGAGQLAGVNGINGSRDITATEGTKSFTSGALTIGSKIPQAIKDVPQSVSVLTSEQMKQQNVTDFNSAMKQLPGITLVQNSDSLSNTFYSRGFPVTSIQVDGGAPLTTQYAFFPQIDMSEYDHVELVRGANGLFDGYGDPGGTINLARKKPLDHSQYTFDAQVGSWSNYRLVADATSPLAFDGRLRGRLVMTWQNNHHFYEVAKDNKELIYGIVELDATPTTLLTVGVNYTRQDSVPWMEGLPRYSNGDDLKLPRSTAIAFPWNRWNFETTELFGGLEQRIGDEWTLKLNVTHNLQKDTQKVGYTYTAVNPLTGGGPMLSGSYWDFASKQLSAEAVLTGAFNILGQRQEIAIGANRVSSDAGGQTTYVGLVSSATYAPYQPYPFGPSFCYSNSSYDPCPAGTIPPGTPPIDVFNFNPSDPLYTEPANPLPSSRYLTDGTVQTGAYVSLRLTAFDRLHLTTGVRWSRYQFKYSLENFCTYIPPSGQPASWNCVGRNIGDAYNPSSLDYRQEHIEWPPRVSLSFDLTKQLTVYSGFTQIHQEQSNLLTREHKPLTPITGSNVEAGLKWAPRNGRLNISLSAYRINQKGFGMRDPSHAYENVGAIGNCCFIDDPNHTIKSEGVDLDITGEVRRGWQLAASYNFNSNKEVGSYFGSSAGQPFTSIQPRNLYKLWTSYDFRAAGYRGALSSLTISGGATGQSSAYYAGTICVNPIEPPPPPGATQTCVSNRPPDTVPYNFTVPGSV